MKKIFLYSILCSFASYVAANDFYVGVGVGTAGKFDAVNGYNDMSHQLTSQKRGSKGVIDFYAGMKLEKDVAVELGYTQFSKLKIKDTFNQSVLSSSNQINVVSLSAIGELPMNQVFSVTGRAGLAYAMAKQPVSVISGNQILINEKGSKGSIKPVIGLGIQAHLSKNLSLGSEYVYMGSIKQTFTSDNGQKVSTKQNLHKIDWIKATYSF
jgi:opacity protein-like surface antigen